MSMYGVLQEQVGWYEVSLPLQERRNRGHFSTPPLLIEHILDACGYTPESDLRSIRVLDPACGSGNFLAAAAHRLLSSAIHANLPPEDLLPLVQRNIWGFDPDPVSCFLAEMHLSSVATAPKSEIGWINPAPDSCFLAEMYLSSVATTPNGKAGCANPASPPAWHIHQTDGLALPWEAPCIDLFLANPPYLAAKNTDLSAYRSTHQRGQADSYLLFLSLGLQIVRPGGWLGLVLPDPLLARTNAANQRARLLKEFTIHHLWHLSGVFTAQVGAVVIIAQKTPPQNQHHVSWRRAHWQQPIHAEPATRRGGRGVDEGRGPLGRPGGWSPAHTIAQAVFQRQPRAELRYLLSTEQASIVARLQNYLHNTPPSTSHLSPLENFLSICRGEELGHKSPHLTQQPPSPNEQLLSVHSRGDPLWSPSNPNAPSNSHPYKDLENQNYYPVLRGGKDTRPYVNPHCHWWIARTAITKPLERYLSPKLLVVKSTDRLQATLDLGGHVALQTLYLLHSRQQSEDELYFFLALLNSRLLRRYVYVLHTAYKWVQPQIEQHVLAQLPVPVATAHEKKDIIQRSKLLARACSVQSPVVEWKSDVQDMFEELERAISALYENSIC